jgi:hypothetical protein
MLGATMTVKQKVILSILAVVMLPLSACLQVEDSENVYVQTRRVQTSLNEAGFRVTDIDQSQPNVCLLPDRHEGSFEEYSFVVFAPFANQSVVKSLTEQSMKDLGIEPNEPVDEFFRGLVGVKGAERYYLTFVNNESALFVATTPCQAT